MLRAPPEEQKPCGCRSPEALCSPALEERSSASSASALEERFGKPVERIGVYPMPILLRDQPGYRISESTATSRTRRSRSNSIFRGTITQRGIGTIFHESDRGCGRQADDANGIRAGIGYAFPVSLTKSWHSAATTNEQCDGERVSMMVTYYVADSFARRLYWKARRALLSLGLAFRPLT